MPLTYEEALQFLFPRTTTIKFGLATTRALLSAVGNPHEVMPSVHVGGTNGKGRNGVTLLLRYFRNIHPSKAIL